ncbi:ATP-binding protein [Gabonibacter massiliensis]|uniref:ATP-binding protein n=1 Tax=Gabonibacter massiliensis TaxID=1720195 RepID=UPI0033078C1D
MKQVFERYYRGDHQKNRDVRGHGQGLYYARMVVSAHGGKINMKSTEGEGSSVIIVLPRKAKVKKTYYHG